MTIFQKITRTFKSGNSIAVRIPKDFGIGEGEELELRQVGDQIRLLRRDRTVNVDAFSGTAPKMRVPSTEDRTMEESPRDWDAMSRQ